MTFHSRCILVCWTLTLTVALGALLVWIKGGATPPVSGQMVDGNGWERFSEDRLVSHREAGRIVLVLFWAEWVFTSRSKTNLSPQNITPAISKAVSEGRVRLMLADMTLSDTQLDVALKRRGVTAIPYAEIHRGTNKPVRLYGALSWVDVTEHIR